MTKAYGNKGEGLLSDSKQDVQLLCLLLELKILQDNQDKMSKKEIALVEEETMQMCITSFSIALSMLMK